MLNRIRIYVPTLVLSTLMLACASPPTRIDAQWVNPQFAGKKPVRDILVMSAVRDSTNRRLFEDQMVAALSAVGVKAVQSYRFAPEEGPLAEQRLRSLVAEAGVSHAMVSRVGNVTTQVNVSPGMMVGPGWGPGWGMGGLGWGGGWGGFHGYYGAAWTALPPTVTTSQDVHADTRLFDAKSAAVIWSAATTTSLGYDSVPTIMSQFAQLIVSTLTKDGVI